MFKRLLIIFTTVALAACSPFDSEAKKVMAACASITAAVNTLSINGDKMDDKQKAEVLYLLNSTVTPICGQGPEPTFDRVTLSALLSAQAELSKLVNQVQNK